MKTDKIAIATVYLGDFAGDDFADLKPLMLRNKVQYVFYAEDLFPEEEMVDEMKLLIRVTNLAETICEGYGLPVKLVVRWNKLHLLLPS